MPAPAQQGHGSNFGGSSFPASGFVAGGSFQAPGFNGGGPYQASGFNGGGNFLGPGFFGGSAYQAPAFSGDAGFDSAGQAGAIPSLQGVEAGNNARRLAELAKDEIRRNPGNGRWCFNRVANSLDKLGIVLKGLSAKMAADQLARHPKVREVNVPARDLPRLPAGAIVVWDGRNEGHGHGHISIADGNGTELSDVKRKQITNYGSKHRVFIPIG